MRKVTTIPPKGALDLLDVRLLLIEAKTDIIDIWYVGQLGYSKHYQLTPNSEIKSFMEYSLFLEKVQAVHEKGKRLSQTSFSLMDCNVIQNKYNDHYLFSDFEKAKSYSEFLKNNEDHKKMVKNHLEEVNAIEEILGIYDDDYDFDWDYT